MKQNKKEVISTVKFINFKPFVEWYKRNYKSENIAINKNVIIYWFNWITFNKYMNWLNAKYLKNLNCLLVKKVKINQKKLPLKFEKESIKIFFNFSDFDFIIIGCGITPDFIYPLLI